MLSCKQKDSHDCFTGITEVTLTEMKAEPQMFVMCFTKMIKNKVLFLKGTCITIGTYVECTKKNILKNNYVA